MEKRNVYMKKLEENLTEFNSKIVEMNAKAAEIQCDMKEYNTILVEMKVKVAEIQSDLKAEYLSQVENLESKRNEFVVEYGRLVTSGHAWNDIKVGTEKTWSEFKTSIERAESRCN